MGISGAWAQTWDQPLTIKVILSDLMCLSVYDFLQVKLEQPCLWLFKGRVCKIPGTIPGPSERSGAQGRMAQQAPQLLTLLSHILHWRDLVLVGTANW